MSNVGAILSTVGDVEYRGECSIPRGYTGKCGGYLEDRGGYSIPWG